ncbi:AraC family transcriptional regulator [Tomitella gaofuii]|uniref:AraC family transcriptional regulator n=1 Tax=Tomitella gaofuii TaxID=2760083 RepID=UPI0015FB161A|nr:AraC family transcriptional regulator [Tomitella gaofuii]
MRDVIRGSSLAHVVESVRELGGDAYPWLADLGIATGVVGDYRRCLRYSQLAALVGRATTELSAPDFSLRLSRRQTIDMTGPVAVLARNAATLEGALEGVIAHLPSYSPAVALELRGDDETALLVFRTTVPRLPYAAEMSELSLGVVVGMLRMLCGSQFRPEAVTFRHRRRAPERAYAQRFECPVRFGAEEDGVLVPRSLLQRPLAHRDSQAYALAEDYLGTRLASSDAVDRVNEILPRLMPIGQAGLATTASALAVHPRTLERELARRGTSFASLLDESRRALAEDLLRGTELPLSSIATQLGYSEQSTLTRSCRRWFGAAPRSVRKESEQNRW